MYVQLSNAMPDYKKAFANLIIPKAKKLANRHRDFLADSTFLQFLYGSTLVLGARIMAGRGNLLNAVNLYCSAGRRVQNIPRLKQIVRKECLSTLNKLVRPKGDLIDITENPFLHKFLSSDTCRQIIENALRENIDIVSLNSELLILKKYNEISGEKGVLYVNFTFRQQQLLAFFDIPLLSKHYILVIEPSWAGSMLPHYFCFIGKGFDVVIEFPLDEEIEFIRDLDSNLIPIKLGSCDWVDHNAFKPLPNLRKEYDLIMVANWAPWKGHTRLFKALKAIKSHKLKVALVGYPLGGRTKDTIARLLKKYGIEDKCDVFEGIPPQRMNELLNKSKVNILLSRREGANRSIFEAMMAGIPIILYRRNNSINHEFINWYTGRLADDHELPHVILNTVNNYKQYSSRQWALANMGYLNATKKLNNLLRTIPSSHTWTTDIVPKVNSGVPNITWASAKDKQRMEEGYLHLKTMLRKQPGIQERS